MKSAEKILDAELADPVCGRHITEASALLRDEYRGRTYLFCSERCRMLFSLRPDAYAIADEADGAAETLGEGAASGR
jgi:YHS domain-containing protein